MKIGPSQNFEALEPRLVMSGDRLGPLAPDAIALTAASDTGVVGDFITSDTTPEFSWQIPRDRGGRYAAGTSSRYEWRVERVDAGMPELTAFGSAPTRGVTTPLAEGNYRFSIRYQDNGNRWGDWGQRDFTVSQSAPLPPTIRLIDAPFFGSTETGSTNPAFELGPASAPYAEFYTALRLESGETIYGISQSNIVRPAELLAGNLPDGSHTLFVRARDLQGNLNDNWSGLTFRVDRTAPFSFGVSYFERLDQNPDRYFYWDPREQGMPYYYWQVHNADGEILDLGRIEQDKFWRPPISMPGATTFHVRGADPVGNLTDWASIRLTNLGVFDLRGPDTPPGFTMLPANDTGVVGDNRTTNTMPRFTWGVPEDLGGTTYTSYNGYYGVGSVAPGISVGTSSMLRWTISRIENSAWTEVASGDESSSRGPSTPLAPGSYNFRVHYLDLLGNRGGDAGVDFEILPALQPPTISLETDTGFFDSDGVTNSTDPIFQLTTPDAETSRYVEYYWSFHRADGTEFHGVSRSTTIRPSQTYAALANLEDGQHAMYVRARNSDGALTQGWSEKVFTVDTQIPGFLPQVYIERYDRVPNFIRLANAPLRPDVHSGDQVVIWRVPAETASLSRNTTYRVTYQIQSLEGQIVHSGVADGGYYGLSDYVRGVLPLSSVPDGTYRLFVSAIDEAGNHGNWVQADGGEFTIDSTRPAAPVLASGPTGTLAVGAAADFSWLGSTDTGPGPVRYVVKFMYLARGAGQGTTIYQSFTLVEGTSLRIAPDFGYGPGRVRWSVLAFDQADNAIESGFREFTLV